MSPGADSPTPPGPGADDLTRPGGASEPASTEAGSNVAVQDALAARIEHALQEFSAAMCDFDQEFDAARFDHMGSPTTGQPAAASQDFSEDDLPFLLEEHPP